MHKHEIKLKNRFIQLCLRLSGHADAARIASDAGLAFSDIINRYNEPHRRYHTMTHIATALKNFDAIHDYLSDPVTAEMALWLHDVIYNPQRADNEEASARYAMDILRRIGCDMRAATIVSEHIMATRHLYNIRITADARYIVDIDLASLGATWKTFQKNGMDIRKEYSLFDDVVFTNNRIAFLESMLARPHIYTTGIFRTRYEMQARKNITKAIHILHKSLV